MLSQRECNRSGADTRFRSGDWEACRGREQTAYFMTMIMSMLPERYLARLNSSSIVDVGCALGDGVDCLTRAFPAASITGVDQSLAAVERGKQFYPGLDLRVATIEDFPDCDVVVCSNVLEHFADPLSAFRELLRRARWLVVVLTPFEESPPGGEHESVINESTFPVECEGFKRVYTQTVDTRLSGFWCGDQLFQVYER